MDYVEICKLLIHDIAISIGLLHGAIIMMYIILGLVNYVVDRWCRSNIRLQETVYAVDLIFNLIGLWILIVSGAFFLWCVMIAPSISTGVVFTSTVILSIFVLRRLLRNICRLRQFEISKVEKPEEESV